MKAEITIGGKEHEEAAVRADAAGMCVSEGLIAVEDENGRVGYINQQGEWVYSWTE